MPELLWDTQLRWNLTSYRMPGHRDAPSRHPRARPRAPAGRPSSWRGVDDGLSQTSASRAARSRNQRDGFIRCVRQCVRRQLYRLLCSPDESRNGSYICQPRHLSRRRRNAARLHAEAEIRAPVGGDVGIATARDRREPPFDWGFVPSTRAADGNPVDAMLLWMSPPFPAWSSHAAPLGCCRWSRIGPAITRQSACATIGSVAPRRGTPGTRHHQPRGAVGASSRGIGAVRDRRDGPRRQGRANRRVG